MFLALLTSTNLHAVVNNYVGVYGQLGEWSLRPDKNSAYGASLGVEGGAGMVYELQAGSKYKRARFLLDVGVGAWGGMTAFRQGTNMTTVLPDQLDLQGAPFDYVYEVTDRHDQYRNVAVQVPILVGMQYRRFYFLAGVKLNSALYTKAATVGEVTTYGRYAQFSEFRNMPEYQFFNDIPFKGTADAHLRLDMNVSLEVGGRLGIIAEATGYDVPKRLIECRIAGFIDYGVTDVHRQASNEGFIIPSWYDTDPQSPNYVYQSQSMIQNLQVNEVMSTTGFASKVNNFMVGVKFTVLFEIPGPQKCVLCQDAYRSSYRYRGGGMKFEE